MKLRLRFFRLRNAVLIFLPILLLAGYAVHESVGYSYGIADQSKIGCGPLNSGCHGSQSANTVISLSTDSAQIVAGKTYVFRLSVSNSIENAAGCDISVDGGGKLAVNGKNSGLWIYPYTTDLTHNTPNVFPSASQDSAVWTFKYTAPTKTGIAHIFVACNAVNLDNSADAQDHWNLLVDTLDIVAASVTPNENAAASIQIFPNPSATGRFMLSMAGMTGRSDVSVCDASGKPVFHFPISLGMNEPLDLSSLPNGTYFVSLHTRDGQQLMKRVVVAR